LVLELLALLRVEEELRERVFLANLEIQISFNFSIFAGLRACFQTYVHAFLALLVDTHLQFPGLQLYYLVL